MPTPLSPYTLKEERTIPLEGLRQGRIGDVTLVLVELARGKKTARRNKHLVELIHNGGFADSRITGNEHQLRCAASYDAVKKATIVAMDPFHRIRCRERKSAGSITQASSPAICTILFVISQQKAERGS
jgi:hypothetical protein